MRKSSYRADDESSKVSPSSSGSSSSGGHKHNHHRHHHHHHESSHKKHHKNHDAHSLYSSSERELLQISPLKIVIRDPLKATGAIGVVKEEICNGIERDSKTSPIGTNPVVNDESTHSNGDNNLSNHELKMETDQSDSVKEESEGQALTNSPKEGVNCQTKSDFKIETPIDELKETLVSAVQSSESTLTQESSDSTYKGTFADCKESMKKDTMSCEMNSKSDLENIEKCDSDVNKVSEQKEAVNSFLIEQVKPVKVEANGFGGNEISQEESFSSCNNLNSCSNNKQEHSTKVMQNGIDGIANNVHSGSDDKSAASNNHFRAEDPFKGPYSSSSKDSSFQCSSTSSSSSSSKHKSSSSASSSSSTSHSKSSHHSSQSGSHKDKASHHSSKSHSSGRSSSSSHHNASSKSHRDQKSSSSSSRSSKSRENRGVQVNLDKDIEQTGVSPQDISTGNVIFKGQQSMSHIESLTRLGLTTQHSQFPVLPKFSKYLNIERYSNGGAHVVHAYHSELTALCKSDMEEFVDHYFDLVFGEPVEGESRCVMGIVHGAASPMPDFLDYLVETDPNLSVKTGNKGKSDIETTTISKFRDQVRNTKSILSAHYGI